MTHDEAIIELTRIFSEYPSLITVTKLSAEKFPDVPASTIVLELLTRDNICT